MLQPAMNRILSTHCHRLPCRLDDQLGSAIALCRWEELDQLGGKPNDAGMFTAIAGSVNPERFLRSGRCRIILTTP
jgi:hypothetical protein